MDDLERYRTALFHVLRQRKEQINRISMVRRRAKSSTEDENLISAANLFEQWGFMDYIAARTLLLTALEASLKPPMPRKFDPPSSALEQPRRLEQQYVVSALAAGELIWPACALAATSVEKYCKAIVTVGKKKIPAPTHLTSRLINQVENSVTNIFSVVDRQFLEGLRILYDLRYHTKSTEVSTSKWLAWLCRLWDRLFKTFTTSESIAQGSPRVLAVSVRGILAELDFTIFQLNESIQTTANGIPQESSHDLARKMQSQALYKENYFLMGMDKDTFWRQHDLHGTLSSFGDPNDTARGWVPVKNGTTDGFFFMRGVPLDPATIQARRDECTYSEGSLSFGTPPSYGKLPSIQAERESICRKAAQGEHGIEGVGEGDPGIFSGVSPCDPLSRAAPTG